MIIPVQLCLLYIARFRASNNSLFISEGTTEKSFTNVTVT